MFCRSLFVLFFLLAIVLSVLLRYTVSDYPFGIFKLFFLDSSQGNSTYTATMLSKEKVIDNHKSVLCSFGLSMRYEDY